MAERTPSDLPPCGIYRTTTPIGEVPAGRLVYFHNHGEPGPGIYAPRAWHLNRAEFNERGHTLPTPYPRSAATLEPLPPEGFYRVAKTFHCCEKLCVEFLPETFVQLGYDMEAKPIVFRPAFGPDGFTFPDEGTVIRIEDARSLVELAVAETPPPVGATIAEDDTFEPPTGKKKRNHTLH